MTDSATGMVWYGMVPPYNDGITVCIKPSGMQLNKKDAMKTF